MKQNTDNMNKQIYICRPINCKILKVPVPKSVEKWIFLKLADMVTFPTNYHPGLKNANEYLICKHFEKTMFMVLIVS